MSNQTASEPPTPAPLPFIRLQVSALVQRWRGSSTKTTPVSACALSLVCKYIVLTQRTRANASAAFSRTWSREELRAHPDKFCPKTEGSLRISGSTYNHCFWQTRISFSLVGPKRASKQSSIPFFLSLEPKRRNGNVDCVRYSRPRLFGIIPVRTAIGLEHPGRTVRKAQRVAKIS